MTSLSAEQIRWYRLRRSGLVTPFDAPETAAADLAGIQAQILSAAALSLWNRTKGLSYAAFEEKLYRRRSLVKLWGQRHTLHLYPSREWPLIYAAMRQRKSWWLRQMEKRGGETAVAAFRDTVDHVTAILNEKNVIGREDLRRADVAALGLDEELLSSWGGIFSELVQLGRACHAEPEGSAGRFARREHWLPDLEWNPPPTDAANVELAWRFFHTYGPATVQDFAYWRGAKVGTARRWLEALGEGLVEIEADGQPLLALHHDVAEMEVPPPETWPIRLLYRFDPLLLAHRDKSWLIDMDYYKRVWRAAGHVEGVVLINGRITGTWRYKRRSKGLTITVYPFTQLTAAVETAVAQIGATIAEFFGLTLQDLVIE